MDSTSVWTSAFDFAHAIEREFPDSIDMTVDQRLKLAEVMALLAIGQELSAIHHEGINPSYSSGV